MRYFALLFALLFIACGTGPNATSPQNSHPPASAPSTTLAATEGWTTCENPDGFGLAHPPSWMVNPGDIVPPCSMFHPVPFDVPKATDERVAAISAYIDPVPFLEATSPDPEKEETRAATVIDGFQAVRVEEVSDGEGLYPEGTRITIYMVGLLGTDGGPSTLFLDTVELPGFDYPRNVMVLDRMARTLEITAGPAAPENLVARYESGGGAVPIEAHSQDGEVCLRIPPEGQPHCLSAPPADGLETTSLSLVGGRQVLAGLAGEQVFRLEAHQADGEVIGFLPAPVPDSDLRGWGFTFGPEGVDRLVWYDLEGRELGRGGP